MANKNDKLRQVDLATRDLVLTNDQLKKVSSLLLHEFNVGLDPDTHPTAIVKMYPTFVQDVPNGQDEGRFLALDLGGTKFRVLLVELQAGHFNMDNQAFTIPQQLMLGTGEQLFDHIARCLSSFMTLRGLEHQKLPLGFTFSFPCSQEGLSKARLVQWTKGFACTGVEGQDVAQLLRQAIAKHPNLDIDVVAVVNDTTGTLMSCAHKNAECRVGVIVGTGTNACYMEDSGIVNTEWGAFGDNGCLEFVRTDWDRDVDANSLNNGRQVFEKMISGMYIGELVRCALADLTRQDLIFGGRGSDQLFTRNSFGSEYVSRIDSEEVHTCTELLKIVKDLGLGHADEEDMLAIKLICMRVSTRAAHLVAAAVATILNKIGRSHTTVGVDGSVYRYHPHFHDLMQKKIAELTRPEFGFDLTLSEDGSGRGAALVAAVAVRQTDGSQEKSPLNSPTSKSFFRLQQSNVKVVRT